MSTPVNHQRPYYGVTRAQLEAGGHDPDLVEEGRLAAIEDRRQQARHDEAQVFAATQEAVATGDTTYPEAAAGLHAAGLHGAHALLVQEWQQEEAEVAAVDASDELAVMDSSQYVERFAAHAQRERATQEAEAEELKRKIAQAQVTAIQKDLTEFVATTPGAHQLAPAVERRIIQNLQASGVLPSTPGQRAAVIESAVKEVAILGAAEESIQQQVDQEWRLHRRQSAGRDGLTTQADIARAEDHFKRERFKQLADNTTIHHESLKPGPTAEEQSAALVDKYRGKQERSTGFHTQVAGIAERGKDANAVRDRGEGISEEKRGYRDAMQRAEETAYYGTARTSIDAPEKPSAKPAGYGPDGTWPDELGPAL